MLHFLVNLIIWQFLTFSFKSKGLGRIHLVAANGEEEENLIPCSDFWEDRNVAYVAYSIHVCTQRLSTLFQRRKCCILHLHKVYLVDDSSYLDDIRLSHGMSFICPSFLALSQVPLLNEAPLRVFTISFSCVHGFSLWCYLTAYTLRTSRDGVPSVGCI